MSSTTLKAVRIVCVAFGLAVLALMLFYPFEGDQATSAVGGEMALRRGAIAYNDFIDTRPQLIFWIYGLASMLFGHHEWSIRAFDMIYQIASLFIFYFVLRKILKDETVAFVSVIVYTIVYVGTGYDSTALTETFFFLPGILLLYYTEDIAKDRKAFRSGLYAGLCSGILFWLKFTFIAASGAAIIYLIINRSVKRQDIFRFCLGHLLSLGALIGMYVLFLSVTGALPRFLEAMHWVRGYTIGTYGTPTKALPGSSLFKMYPNGFILEYGLTCLVLLAIGIVNVVRKQAQLASGYSHLCLQVLIGLLAVYYEGKSYKHHYARFFFASIPLISYGLLTIFRILRTSYNKWRSQNKLQGLLRAGLLLPLIPIALIYSPVIRLTYPVHLAYLGFMGKDVAQDIENNSLAYNSQVYYYKELTTVADTLRPKLGSTDEIFFWGEDVGVYFQLNRLPTTICLKSMSMATPYYTPVSWQQSVLQSLELAPTRFVIAEVDDAGEITTSSSVKMPKLSENWSIESWPELSSFVHSHYSERAPIGHFRIFELNR